MAWWKTLFGRLTEVEQAVHSDWRRWVMLDCESTGLNPNKDKLLSISAIGLHLDDSTKLHIDYQDRFEVVLNHDASSYQTQDTAQAPKKSVKENVLIHGIGLGQQRQGIAPSQAMQDFSQFVGSSPLLAFHAGFDQALLAKAMHDFVGIKLSNPWVDLEHICALYHQEHRRFALDHWLARYRIVCAQRHNASADTLASAELLLALWPRLRDQKQIDTWAKLVAFASGVRHLAGRG